MAKIDLRDISLVIFFSLSLFLIGTIAYILNDYQQTDTKLNTHAANPVAPLASPYGFSVDSGINLGIILRYKDLHMYWIRDVRSWKSIEVGKNRQGVAIYNWNIIDKEIQLANQNGIHVSFPIADPPVWRAEYANSVCHSMGIRYPTSQAMQQFAHDLVLRYSTPWGTKGSNGYIDTYEIGDNSFTPLQLTAADQCRTPENYVPLLKSASIAIKSVNANATIGLFASGWDNLPAYEAFLQKIYNQSNSSYFNYIPLEYFNNNIGTRGNPSLNDPANPNFPTFDQLWKGVHQVMLANKDTLGEIWFAQIGWQSQPSGSVSASSFITSSQQAEYIRYILNESKNASGVIGKVFIYTIANDTPSSTTYDVAPESSTDSTQSLAYATIKNYISQYPGWGNYPTPTK